MQFVSIFIHVKKVTLGKQKRILIGKIFVYKTYRGAHDTVTVARQLEGRLCSLNKFTAFIRKPNY